MGDNNCVSREAVKVHMKKTLTSVVLLIHLWASSAVAKESLALQLVDYQDYPEHMKFDGVVEAVKQATISAQTSGRVTEINVDVDDFVSQGSVIMRLSDNEQRSQLDAAEAAFHESEAIYTQAKSEHQRITDLYEKKLLAKSALDQSVAELKSSEQRRNAAEAKHLQAKEQMSYTVISAPFSGIVVARHIELGEVAKVGQPLMTGFAVDDMRVTASVPQDYIELVRQNQAAQVMLEKPNQQSLRSEVMTFYPYADPITHTFKVRVGLPGGLKGVYPGMMVKVAFITGNRSVLAIDPKAIVYRSEVSAVYVVDGNDIKYRQVRLGRKLQDGRTEVLAGLHAGEKVSLNPVQAGILLKHRSQTGE